MVRGTTSREAGDGRDTPGPRQAAQRVSDSRFMSGLGRAGLAARGVMYVLIGTLAVLVAFGQAGHEADGSGALRLVAQTPFGGFALWLLVAGFSGMALWGLSEAVSGASGPDGRKAPARLAALGRAVVYGFVVFSILKYALGVGAPESGDQRSKDLTAEAMKLPGGQVFVALVGAAFVGGALALAYSAVKKKFLKTLDLAAVSLTTRRAVERLGQVGGIARGTVFAMVGVFLVVSAAQYQPGEAKGVDSALRAVARAPAGPFLLVLVAAGLITFGVYSFCEARWRDV
jgi:uncharacterized protein DUF1206